MNTQEHPITDNAARLEVDKLPQDIHALIDRAQVLGQKVDWWNATMLWALAFAAVAAVAVGLATWRVVTRSKELGDVQEQLNLALRSKVATLETGVSAQQERAAKAEKELREVDLKTESFRLAIANANERAAKAQESLAEAEQHSAEANAKAEGFRRDIAEANARASEANRIAEQERLARLQLEARLADRIITPDQQRRIAEAFAPMKGHTVDVVIVGDTPEVNRTADAIVGCLQDAGVPLNLFHPFTGGAARGVIVGVRADAPEADKQAGTKLIAILRETLGGGVGSVDFDKIVVTGTGTVGSTPGAGRTGESTVRLQIAPK